MSKKLRRTKIVITLGPATDSPQQLEHAIIAGANVARLNFSHGSAQEHRQRAERVRAIASKLGTQVALLGDLQGPKVRIARFVSNQITLRVGDTFTLDATLPSDQGDAQQVGIDYTALPQDVATGDTLLLDDGRIQLKVQQCYPQKIVTLVTVGGILSNHKGINKLGGGLSAAALTDKDRADIILAAELAVDYLAVSFPRCANDIHEARQLALAAGSQAALVAKIERAEAVSQQGIIDEIILAAEAIMVARGDLGVEIGDAALVGVQKELIRRARSLDRIVITATQMMESMIQQPLPTRAEVLDVANAVLDGTDAVMLSAETATGHYPVETVQAMADICLGAETMPSVTMSHHRIHRSFSSIEETVAMATMYAANHLQGVVAIIAMTESGRTALIMSRISSGLPIFALSRHSKTLNLTTLYRGVTPVLFDSPHNGRGAIKDALQLLKQRGWLNSGDVVLVTQGDEMGIIGSTNTCRILQA
ncbi:MAG: pyruvate kinase [Candidatus Symbiodolus clandestinus]